ncbi:MAG: tRNA-binding protein, partial [Streptosporangiaceae bacterium]
LGRDRCCKERRDQSMKTEQTEIAPQTTIDCFLAVDIRVGQVIRAEPFPKARNPAYKLWIDFGDLGVRKSSAQVTKLYTPQELRGQQVLAVVNFPPRQVADFMSEVLVLGVPTGEEAVVLIGPDREVPAGLRIL